MKAVIYVCHGSRVQTAREQAITFIQKCIAKTPAPIKEYCFLELARPTIAEAFIKCVQQGATDISVMPFLLLAAAHAKTDIPNVLEQMSARFPSITIHYGQPIGVNPQMIAPITQRIRETGVVITEKSLVLLVGRGSSDPDARNDLNRIGSIFAEQTERKKVKTCFITAGLPSLEEGLHAAAEGSYDKIFVVPYLLFAGILMKRLKLEMQRAVPSEKFILCQCLGYSPFLEKILLENVRNLLRQGNTSQD